MLTRGRINRRTCVVQFFDLVKLHPGWWFQSHDSDRYRFARGYRGRRLLAPSILSSIHRRCCPARGHVPTFVSGRQPADRPCRMGTEQGTEPERGIFVCK